MLGYAHRKTSLGVIGGLAIGLSMALAACGGGGGGGGGGTAGNGSGGGPPPGPISVSVAAQGQTTLLPSATVQMTATVTNDAANQGVTWTVSCGAPPCGTVAPASTGSGVATRYTAPVGLTAGEGVMIIATSVSDKSASSSTTVQIGITLSIDLLGPLTWPGAGVEAGATTQLSVNVSNDPTHGGVAWAVSCATTSCGSISPAQSNSGTPVTYTAPVVPPTGNLAINIIATSSASSSVQVNQDLTLLAIQLAVVPVSALLPLNVSQRFSGTASYDNADQGVTWSLSQDAAPCSPTCGTVAPPATASGSPTAYTASATLPANPTVVLTATSVTDPTKSAPATVTLTNGSVSLVPADLQFSAAQAGPEPPRAQPPQVVVLTNTGNSTLMIGSMTLGGTDPGFFAESNTCGAAVAAGTSCTISVTYASRHTGTHTAVLSIVDDSPDSPQQVHLTGLGKAALTAALHAALRAEVAASAPSPTGTSKVGTRVMRLVDASREDPYLANGTKRELIVRFWYPASGNGSCTPAEYTSPRVWSEFARLLGTTLPQVVTNSCLNVPVADGAHPVVVVSHGFTGTFTDYTFLTEDLASRGYVVASVDHTYEATAVEFPDGRLEKGVFGSYLTSYTRSDPQALAFAVSVRLDDLRFVLDELTSLAREDSGVFGGKLDLSRIALVGHSLGGLTAIRGVQRDVRFRAGISLDGLAPDRLTPPTSTPVLLVTAGRAHWNENDCQLWAALRGVHLAVNLSGVEHTAISDAVWLSNGAVKTGPLGVAQTIATVREASASFLNAVFTEAAADSTASRVFAKDPNVTVITKSPPGCAN